MTLTFDLEWSGFQVQWCGPHADFDLWPSKSNQFTVESEWTIVQSFKGIPDRVLETLRSQARAAGTEA